MILQQPPFPKCENEMAKPKSQLTTKRKRLAYSIPKHSGSAKPSVASNGDARVNRREHSVSIATERERRS